MEGKLKFVASTFLIVVVGLGVFAAMAYAYFSPFRDITGIVGIFGGVFLYSLPTCKLSKKDKNREESE